MHLKMWSIISGGVFAAICTSTRILGIISRPARRITHRLKPLLHNVLDNTLNLLRRRHSRPTAPTTRRRGRASRRWLRRLGRGGWIHWRGRCRRSIVGRPRYRPIICHSETLDKSQLVVEDRAFGQSSLSQVLKSGDVQGIARISGCFGVRSTRLFRWIAVRWIRRRRGRRIRIVCHLRPPVYLAVGISD